MPVWVLLEEPHDDSGKRPMVGQSPTNRLLVNQLPAGVVRTPDGRLRDALGRYVAETDKSDVAEYYSEWNNKVWVVKFVPAPGRPFEFHRTTGLADGYQDIVYLTIFVGACGFLYKSVEEVCRWLVSLF